MSRCRFLLPPTLAAVALLGLSAISEAGASMKGAAGSREKWWYFVLWGGATYTGMQQLAASASAPGFFTTTGRHIEAHPRDFLIKAGEIGLTLTPLPEALGAYEGVKAMVDLYGAGADLLYSLHH